MIYHGTVPMDVQLRQSRLFVCFGLSCGAMLPRSKCGFTAPAVGSSQRRGDVAVQAQQSTKQALQVEREARNVWWQNEMTPEGRSVIQSVTQTSLAAAAAAMSSQCILCLPATANEATRQPIVPMARGPETNSGMNASKHTCISKRSAKKMIASSGITG